jgi:hypothetical protein
MDYLPNAKMVHFSQIIDIVPDKFTNELVLEYLKRTLENEKVFKRNPLLFSENSSEAFQKPQIIKYGSNTFLCYPSLYIDLFETEPIKNGTEYRMKSRKNIFFGICPHKDFDDRQLDLTINDIKITKYKKIKLPTLYDNSDVTMEMLYFPEFGVVQNQEIVIKVPLKFTFAFAFGVFSPTLERFFRNKRIKTHK